MRQPFVRAMACLIATSLVGGCVPNQEGGWFSSPPTPATAPPDDADDTLRPSDGPADALKTGQTFYQLLFYQLIVPQGSISANAEFWKPFDETFLGFETHEMLHRNGLRAGRAPLNELRVNLLEDAETTESRIVGTISRDFEIDVRREIAAQTVNCFDRAGRQEMRDFERCENLFTIGFRQVPRQPDHVRLTLAPAVRGDTPQLSIDPLTGGIRSQRPFTLYDVGLACDVGVDECLVIAPSPEAAKIQMSVGRLFLMEDRPSARVEKLLVIVPRVGGTMTEIQNSAAP